MTLESSKTLGGIGALLIFICGILFLVSFFRVTAFLQYFWLIGIAGVILLLIALHDFGKIYKEKGIFNNAIYGVAVAIIGGIVTTVLTLAVVLANIRTIVTQLFPGWNGDWSSLQGMTPNTTNFDPTSLLPFIAGILVVLVILWIFAIIAAFFVWRSLKQVSNRSGNGLFGTAGLILLIGAIIPILGLFLMWISSLMLSVAFFTLQPQEQPMPSAPPTTV
jgi:uncharacterized membrane protein